MVLQKRYLDRPNLNHPLQITMAEILFEVTPGTDMSGEIAQQVRDFFLHFDQADWPWFHQSHSAKYVAYHGTERYERGPYLDSLTGGGMKMTRCKITQLETYSDGNIGWARYRSDVSFQTDSGEAIDCSNWETLIYHKEPDGVWRMVHSHA